MSHLALQNMKKIRCNIHISFLFIIFFVGFNLLLNLQLMAQGNLKVTPMRVIFDAQKRILELNVSNDSQDSAKYVLSFVQIRMTEEGVMQWINTPDPGQKFADKYIRIFPRTVRLGPGDTQIVRLQLTKTDQMEQGEYRSHLYFKSLVPQKPLGATDVKKDSGVFLNIEATFGITIPVFIRVGESTTKLNINDMKIETAANGSKQLKLTLNRTGNMSVYGEISVIHVAPNGKETKIGVLGNIAVYTPNALLRQIIDLDDKKGTDLSRGKLRIVFTSKTGTNNEKLAEAELMF